MRLVTERAEAELRREARARNVEPFASMAVRELLRDPSRWQFERSVATLHLRPGDVASEAAGRFEISVPYSLLASSVRRTGPLGPLVPREDHGGATPDGRLK